MPVFTEGQHKGEHIVSLFQGANAQNGGDISVENGVYANGHGTIVDGTVIVLSGGKLIPATGAADTGGDSSEDVVGTAFGNINTANGDVKGPYVARLAVLDASLVITSGSRTALLAALAKLFIIAR